MLMMRLQRIGRRNEAHFKIVVIEKSKGPKSQKYVDIIGSYNPKLGNVQIDKDKASNWLSNGVQPSDTVRNFLIDQGLLEGQKVNVLPKKSPTKKRNAPEEEKAPEPVAEEPASEDTASAEEAPAEEAPAEEAPAEEAPAEEAPAEEAPAEEEKAE
jgi:small subunit ribosomal protein S16